MCENIEDARDYTINNIMASINVDIQQVFDQLYLQDLDKYEKWYDDMEEAIRQIRCGIPN